MSLTIEFYVNIYYLYIGGKFTLGSVCYRESPIVFGFWPNKTCTGMENNLTECGGIYVGICSCSAVAVIACHPTGKSREILSLLLLDMHGYCIYSS